LGQERLARGNGVFGFWFKIASSEYLSIIRNALTLTLPVVIAGAFGVLLNNFPIMVYQNMMKELFGEGWRAFGGYIWDGTLAILSPVTVFTIGYNIAERYNRKHLLDNVHPAILGTVAFCSLLTMIEPSTKDFAIPYNWVGIHGLFLAIIVSLVSSELFLRFFGIRSLRIRFFSKEAGTAMSTVFSALGPAALTIGIFALFKVGMAALGVNDIHSLIYDAIASPFKNLGNNLGTALIYNFIRHFLWFLGIHGSNAMEPVMTEIYMSAMRANELAVAAGQRAPFIITKTFFDTYVSMGGAGNTLSLLLALLLTHRRSGLRKIAQISFLPAVFNINETLIFGLPIVLNPVYFIPFILTPMVLTVTSYYAAALGFLPESTMDVAWTTPVLISGYAAAGSFAGSVVQLFNLLLGFLIYWPFIRIDEKAQRLRFEASYDELLRVSGNLGESCANLTDQPGEIGSISRALANDLLESIKKKELFLEYQPQVDCSTGKVVGVEALLRWKHANIGRVPPSLFVALAEEVGFIGEIGVWVCDESCRQMRQWLDHGLTGIVMSFNVSVKQLGDPDLPEKIAACIKKYELDPSCMKAEVTESTGLSSDMGHNILLQDIRHMGVNIAIDDFGMGHSSLVYLKQFPVAMIKLDGSLVRDVTVSKISSDIISSISDLCRTMDIELLAEFVETEAQAVTLKSLGCHVFQGWLYSRALPPDECESAIRSGFRTY
jgi:cellobiose-specific phosphotransferase system IIC component